MKKAISVMLVLVSLFGICACRKQPEPIRIPVEIEMPDYSGLSDIDFSDVEFRYPDTEAVPMTFGSYEDDIYSNAYIGMACELGDAWEVEVFPLEEGEDPFVGVGDDVPVSVMQCRRLSDGVSIMIKYLQAPANTTQEELEGIVYSQEQMDATAAAFEVRGAENVTMEEKTVVFCGETVKMLCTKLVLAGVEVCQYSYHCMTGSDVFVQIMLMGETEEEADALAGLFYSYSEE